MNYNKTVEAYRPLGRTCRFLHGVFPSTPHRFSSIARLLIAEGTGCWQIDLEKSASSNDFLKLVSVIYTYYGGEFEVSSANQHLQPFMKDGVLLLPELLEWGQILLLLAVSPMSRAIKGLYILSCHHFCGGHKYYSYMSHQKAWMNVPSYTVSHTVSPLKKLAWNSPCSFYTCQVTHTPPGDLFSGSFIQLAQWGGIHRATGNHHK